MPTIKEARKKLRLTQKQFGKLMGMNNVQISRIENHHQGRKETIQHRTHLIAVHMLAKHELLEEFKDELRRLLK